MKLYAKWKVIQEIETLVWYIMGK